MLRAECESDSHESWKKKVRVTYAESRVWKWQSHSWKKVNGTDESESDRQSSLMETWIRVTNAESRMW